MISRFSSNFRGLALDGATRYGAFPETRLSGRWGLRVVWPWAAHSSAHRSFFFFMYRSRFFSLPSSLSLCRSSACILYVNGDDLRGGPSIWPHRRNDLKVASASLGRSIHRFARNVAIPRLLWRFTTEIFAKSEDSRLTKYAYEFERWTISWSTRWFLSFDMRVWKYRIGENEKV